MLIVYEVLAIGTYSGLRLDILRPRSCEGDEEQLITTTNSPVSLSTVLTRHVLTGNIRVREGDTRFQLCRRHQTELSKLGMIG